MAKKATAHNTGLTIKRNGSKFTASWKIKTDVKKIDKQEIRYRTHNGSKWRSWNTKTINDKATEYTFSLSSSAKITKIQVQTRILRKPTANYKVSSWSDSSKVYAVEAPPEPTLTVTNTSANGTTFSWSISTSSTNHKWFYRCYYRTKCSNSPDSSSGWGAWTYASNSSYSYNDTTLGTTRIFQIKAVGPGGESKADSKRHNIATAPIATWKKPAVTYTKQSTYYAMTCNFNLTGSNRYVDSIVPQYYFGAPTATMGCPNGASFTDGATYTYKNKKTAYSFALNTSALIAEDQCLWARIKTTHDSVDSFSEPYRVITGNLAAPTATVVMGTITASGFSVTVTLTAVGTSVPGAYAQVFLEKKSDTGTYIFIGSIANGSTSKTINSTINISNETGYAIHVRNVTADGVSMVSDFYSYSSSMPSKPTLNSVTATNVLGKVCLKWTNNWSAATGSVISWTDDPDNWMSNDEPEKYIVSDLSSEWYITGLEAGKMWYFRVRSQREEGDVITYSSWSAQKTVDLSSPPAAPVLYLSEESITENDVVTAYWGYTSTDGTAQMSSNIVLATLSGGVWSYGQSIGSTTSAQHIDIDAKEQGWTNGTTKYLAVQTVSASGGTSAFSTPQKLVIAAKPTVSITTTSLATTDTITEYFNGDGSTTSFVCANALSAAPTAKVDGTTTTVTYSADTVTFSTAPAAGTTVAITYSTTANNVLKAMPLTATVTTTNATTLTLAIERDGDYTLLRPDGVTTYGTDGETIYVTTIDAEATNSFSIAINDLIGKLDDGAFYNLVATVSDNMGQSVTSTPVSFKVHWTHQAWVPDAKFVTDTVNYAARIKPIAGASYASGDTCDIYRLGIDKPELVYSGAAFGTEYVDPFPTFGIHSGYKVVTVTSNSDYITEDNSFAEYDTTNDGGYVQLENEMIVIDFGSDRVELPYNISMDNSWAKDFKRTTYLGGHVVGDHNRAVTRDLSAETVIARKLDTDTAVLMRKLARYDGLCHVRTPEGSSFVADVQVSENLSYDTGIGSYSLTIQKVDNVGFDGMTYSEWSEMQ